MQVHDWISLMLGGAGLGLAVWRRLEILFQRGTRDKARTK